MTKEEAIKWLDSLTQDIGQMRHQALWDYAQALSEISQMIDEMPDIVKCKNCKYYDGDDNCDEPVRWCTRKKEAMFFIADDDYCSRGERRERDEYSQ